MRLSRGDSRERGSRNVERRQVGGHGVGVCGGLQKEFSSEERTEVRGPRLAFGEVEALEGSASADSPIVKCGRDSRRRTAQENIINDLDDEHARVRGDQGRLTARIPQARKERAPRTALLHAMGAEEGVGLIEQGRGLAIEALKVRDEVREVGEEHAAHFGAGDALERSALVSGDEDMRGVASEVHAKGVVRSQATIRAKGKLIGGEAQRLGSLMLDFFFCV
eukprot:SAG11_NODE_769_length_7262_cov_20.934385_4_plen_222_part_00